MKKKGILKTVARTQGIRFENEDENLWYNKDRKAESGILDSFIVGDYVEIEYDCENGRNYYTSIKKLEETNNAEKQNEETKPIERVNWQVKEKRLITSNIMKASLEFVKFCESKGIIKDGFVVEGKGAMYDKYFLQWQNTTKRIINNLFKDGN